MLPPEAYKTDLKVRHFDFCADILFDPRRTHRSFQRRTLDPLWDEEFVFPADGMDKTLVITVYHCRGDSPDDERHVHIPLGQVLKLKFYECAPVHASDCALQIQANIPLEMHTRIMNDFFALRYKVFVVFAAVSLLFGFL